MKQIVAIVVMLLLGSLLGCNNSDNELKSHKPLSKKRLQEAFIYANKSAIRVESEMIDNYIERHQWEMKQSLSGLRYSIYSKGEGRRAEKGLVCKLKYTIGLLDGSICYSSEEDGYKEFVIGKGNVVSGLEEGILLMAVGDKAVFVIPSHLAYGLIGDQDKIGSKASLVYNIELLELGE